MGEPDPSDVIEYEFACAGCGQIRVQKHSGWQAVGIRSGLVDLRKIRLLCPACQAIGREPKVVAPPKFDPYAKEIERWVPPDYRDSDASRFPTAQFSNCKQWIPGPKGMLLHGPTGRFKSRIAYWVLIKCIRNGSRVQAFDCRTFRGEVEKRISAGTLYNWYRDLEHTDVLLLDDMGKFRGEGKRIEEELFNVVKLSAENRHGLIITTNDDAMSMASKFSSSIAQPLVERIVERCSLIDFRTDSERAEPMLLTQDL